MLKHLAWWSQPSFGVDAPTPPPVDVAGSLLLTQPNPFREATTVSFSLDGSGNARLTVHDVAGRLVAELVNGRLPRGAHSRTWGGTDRNGLPVPSGVYFQRLEKEQEVESQRVVRVR